MGSVNKLSKNPPRKGGLTTRGGVIEGQREGENPNPHHVIPAQECWTDLEPAFYYIFLKYILNSIFS